MVVCAGGPCKIIFKEEYPLEDLTINGAIVSDFYLKKWTVARDRNDSILGIFNLIINVDFAQVSTVQDMT